MLGVRGLAVRFGQLQDELNEAPEPLASEIVAEKLDVDMPSIVLELEDRLVLAKPPGWEVHGYGSPQLRSWLAAQARWPILSDAQNDFGFLHRLDVPSSGVKYVHVHPKIYKDVVAKMGVRPGAHIQELCRPLRAAGAVENRRGSPGLPGVGPWLGAATPRDSKAMV